MAVVAPLAAGMEPLNPALATAPPEAKPAGALSLAPTYVARLDDQIGFYDETLPKAVNGHSNGAQIEIAPASEE